MTISPLDIRRQEFNRRMRGYDPDDVRAYLEVVARGVEDLTDEARRREERIRELEAKLVHYERVEEALQEAVHTARESSRQALATAEARAEELRAQAEQAGAEIRRDAEAENLRLRQETQAIAGRRKEIVARLRSFLISEMEMLAHFEGADPVGFIKLMPATGAGDLPPASAARLLESAAPAAVAPVAPSGPPATLPSDDADEPAAQAFAAPDTADEAAAEPETAPVPATLPSGDEDVDAPVPPSAPPTAPASEPLHAPEPAEAPVPAPNAVPPSVEETIRTAEQPSAAAPAEAPLAAHRVFGAPAEVPPPADGAGPEVRRPERGPAPEVGPPPVVAEAPSAPAADEDRPDDRDRPDAPRTGEGTAPWATPVLERRDDYPPAFLPPAPADPDAEPAEADVRGYTHQPLFGPEDGGTAVRGEARNLSASAEEIERIRRLLSGLD